MSLQSPRHELPDHAFDIDKKKVGLDLADAIFAGPNNTVKSSEPPSWASESSAA